MLLELAITDFAIIDELRLILGPSFNVFTGETGAGKSIIIDAVSALVGERVTSDVVRAGCERAIVEGIFDVSALLARQAEVSTYEVAVASAETEHSAEQAESLAEVLAQLGIGCDDGTLILTREVLASGRSIARANRRAVPLTGLQHIARFLIDIHGQSAHLELLRPEQHIRYLDRYANTVELQEQVATLYAQWRATRRDLERLRQNEREIERRIELLRYQVEEISAARLRPGELEELQGERRRLANAERLGELCVMIHNALSGDADADTVGALDQVGLAQRALADLLRLDDTLRDQEAALDQALIFLQDATLTIRSYQDEVAADPQRQAEVEERLDLLAKLRRKYGATIEEIQSYEEVSSAELEELTHREERAAELVEQERLLKIRSGAVAAELSHRRRVASVELAAAMERELDDLNMRRARFQVQILQRPDPDGVPIEGTTGNGKGKSKNGALADATPSGSYALSPMGIDHVEFLIAPNFGEPLKPLARSASGGETSRLMLALKTILANADIVPILIFDEIDSGISGRSGQIVGEKLWQLARTHQILCVTHLPQIAALGDNHYQVTKTTDAQRTMTRVEALEEEERIAELAQMLGGAKTAAARANASELIERSRTWQSAEKLASPDTPTYLTGQ